MQGKQFEGVAEALRDGDLDAAALGPPERLLLEFDIAPRDLPVVIVSGKVLRRPTPGALADYLGLTVGTMPDGGFDLIVVGAGPAGLSAALWCDELGLDTLVLEQKDVVGGQLHSIYNPIENYFGVHANNGEEFLNRRRYG